MRKQKPYIVAEISANHLGKLEHALDLIATARDVGADAVKFQTYTPQAMVCNPDEPITAGTWKGRKLGELYAEAMTPAAWHPDLFRFARRMNIDAFSSVFDAEGLVLLELLDCPCYKIASFELVDLQLIDLVARTGKPIIMSTGMANAEEVYQAVKTARAASPEIHITLLKCTSGYPAPVDESNLMAMHPLLEGFGANAVGFSDHTLGIGAAVAAAALGASMIEKHLCLSRAKGGPDAAFSLEPHEFARMVKACREAAAAIGEPRFRPTFSEMPQRKLRRSLYWSQYGQIGFEVGTDMIRTARPARGLPVSMLPSLVGRRLARNVCAGQPVLEEDLEPIAAGRIEAVTSAPSDS